MIQDHDRSYFIGASDAATVVGNWKTQSFEKWWRTKQGIERNEFTNDSMLTGTFLEHRILDSLGIEMEYDKQFIDGHLRVNLDGNTKDCIYECKTYGAAKAFLSKAGKLPKRYEQQVWVQQYASGIHRAFIIAYAVEDEDKQNFYRDIDPARLSRHEVIYNETWIQSTFLPRLKYLSECLDTGAFPTKEFT